MSDTADEPPAEAVLLREPREGVPDVVADEQALAEACAALAGGSGAIAVDTERASGYRYWPKAYLIQLRRDGAGTHLIDPIALAGKLDPLRAVLNDAEWVLHAASQDMPCLTELGLRPRGLFDTELAARLAGYHRVALGTMVEQLLGYRLEKGHSAADWSTRPLPAAWLSYAALDVELLLPLRDKLAAELAEQGKLDWAEQEFAAILTAPPPEPRPEPWRRTSGIHKIRSPRALAVVRALWQARDELARNRDRAPGRVLPDSAIVAAAQNNPRTIEELRALGTFGGKRQRALSALWMRHIEQARRLPADQLPSPSQPNGGPPPPSRWADRDPEAAARLAAARAGLAELSDKHRIPVENLVLPEFVRRLCWQPPAETDADSVARLLSEWGARPWQVELTAGLLSDALQARADRPADRASGTGQG
ncbi:ribonuclease D [Thermocrispum municipale]|uniref:ribonuclease D n=1 Tax=Thermocrispum municipale TaxID=37926 RepID=UPI0004289202|nr:ribonuclease D [Thermocrispum municipale]